MQYNHLHSFIFQRHLNVRFYLFHICIHLITHQEMKKNLEGLCINDPQIPPCESPKAKECRPRYTVLYVVVGAFASL